MLIQERVCWWAIVFREADSAFLACPRFQSGKDNRFHDQNTLSWDTVHALMCDDSPEHLRPTPYHKEQTDGRRRTKDDKRERADRLRFGRRARLW